MSIFVWINKFSPWSLNSTLPFFFQGWNNHYLWQLKLTLPCIYCICKYTIEALPSSGKVWGGAITNSYISQLTSIFVINSKAKGLVEPDCRWHKYQLPCEIVKLNNIHISLQKMMHLRAPSFFHIQSLFQGLCRITAQMNAKEIPVYVPVWWRPVLLPWKSSTPFLHQEELLMQLVEV